MRISRTRSSLVPGVDVEVGDQQPQRVGAAVEGGDAGHARPPLRRRSLRWSDRRTGQAAHHSPSSSSTSSPSGLTPRPWARDWPASTCRHFTRSGMPPAETPGDLGHLADRRAGGEVGLVGAAVRRGELLVLGQPFGHLAHQAGGLQGADQRGRPRAGQVEGRRERRAVVEPGLGRDHVGVAARAAVGRPRGSTAAAGRAGRRPRRRRRSSMPECSPAGVGAHWSGEGVGSAGGGVMLDFGVGVFFGWSAASRVP